MTITGWAAFWIFLVGCIIVKAVIDIACTNIIAGTIKGIVEALSDNRISEQEAKEALETLAKVSKGNTED